MEFQITPELIESLREAVASGNDSYIKDQISELYAPDISAILSESNIDDAHYILQLVEKEIGAEVISTLDPDKRPRFVASFSPEELASYIDYIDSDDAVDILNKQSIQTRELVIALISNREKANHILDLMHYEEDCAGGLMAKELIRANINWTVTQCIEEIRRQTKNVGKIYSVYVVDDHDKLLGIVSLKKMLLADDHTRIADIFDSDIISVESYRGTEEVAQVMQKYDLEAIPVVNVHGKLLGRITIDDVVDVITEQAEKDMNMMAGITAVAEEDDSVWKLSRVRLPCLMIGMAGGILGARFIGLFESDISLIPAMAFFIPLITATGGNVGIQSSSLVVQSLANNSAINNFTSQRLLKGFAVSLINGLAISLIVLAFNFLIGESMQLSFVVSIALLSVVILSSFLGTITPLLLDKIGINPAMASGPFITTANDLLGLAIYFIVAHALYHL